jgi:hypothetical protein
MPSDPSNPKIRTTDRQAAAGRPRRPFRALAAALAAASALAIAPLTTAHAAGPLTVMVPCDPAALVAAVQRANISTGPVEVDLAANCTYTYTQGQFALPGIGDKVALPPITSKLYIRGDSSVITGNRTDFGILSVAKGGDLILYSTTIMGGRSASFGGILNDGGQIQLVDTDVSENSSVGIANMAGTVDIQGGLVNKNVGIIGGGIFNAGSLYAHDVKIYGNNARMGGGLFNAGRAHLTRSAVYLNLVQGSGGAAGIRNVGRELVLADTTVSRNSPDNCISDTTVPGCQA